MNIPDFLVYPLQPFAECFQEKAASGLDLLASSKVAFVGLARNCAVRLAENLGRLEHLARHCREWSLHIESNDCTDQTLAVLDAFARQHAQATYHYQENGRPHYGSEFAGRRTIALAEYRDACQRWVADCAVDADFVCVVDFDMWGGWSFAGLNNGIGWLKARQDAYGMASVSLMQHPIVVTDDDGTRTDAAWLHYDAWALRLNSPFDDYTSGIGGWKHHWVPPVGSPPVPVCSAFGGLAIYRTAAFLSGTYDGTTDCEHVPFHASIERATGMRLFLNPSQRCIMHWMEPCEAAPQPSA